jgi:hypothetical protein
VVTKLISGAQTGADISIVGVGKRLNLPIGGTVPKGWMTEAGPNPALRKLGFTESDSPGYVSRTLQNVEDADATLVFATDPASDGTRLTLQHANARGKPNLLVDPFDPSATEVVKDWLKTVNPVVLNVAGNRESKSPGIAEAAEKVLTCALADDG